MNRLTRRTAATLAATTCAVAGLVAATGTAAFATGSTTGSAAPASSSLSATPKVKPAHGQGLIAIQAAAASAISERLASLNTAIAAVSSNTILTPADKTTLGTRLTNDLSGLTALGQTIASDTTAKQAAVDSHQVFAQYRVYALMLPQVRYAEAADDLSGGVLPKLQNADSLLAALFAGADATKSSAASQAAMSDLASKISAIESSTQGLSMTVLALTPAQYDANHALLSDPRAELATVRADAKAARADIVTARKALS